MDEDSYQLVAPDGTEGEIAEYGATSCCEYQGEHYMAYVDDGESEKVEVYKCIGTATLEETEFEGSEDEDDELDEEPDDE
jgi:hypothetical protein